MGLSPEDVETIGRLLDDRLARAQEAERRRRRFWRRLWLAVFLLWLGLSVASGMYAWRFLRQAMDQVEQAERGMIEAKVAYQVELQRSRAMQAERAAAEQAVGYRPQQSGAAYEAGLLRGALRLIGEQAAVSKQLEQLDADDPEALEQAAAAMARTTQGTLGLLGTMLLRNTDPAHNTLAERLLVDGEGDAAAPEGAPIAPEGAPIAPEGAPIAPVAPEGAPGAPATAPAVTP